MALVAVLLPPVLLGALLALGWYEELMLGPPRRRGRHLRLVPDPVEEPAPAAPAEAAPPGGTPPEQDGHPTGVPRGGLGSGQRTVPGSTRIASPGVVRKPGIWMSWVRASMEWNLA